MSKNKKQEPIKAIIIKCSNSDLDAQARLWKFLKTEILLNKIKGRIGNLYVDENDVFETSFMAFIQRIEQNGFLPDGDSEAKQQNQVRSYFNRIINTSIQAIILSTRFTRHQALNKVL